MEMAHGQEAMLAASCSMLALCLWPQPTATERFAVFTTAFRKIWARLLTYISLAAAPLMGASQTKLWASLGAANR